MGIQGSTGIPDSLSILGLETTMASLTTHQHAWVEFPLIQRTAGCYQPSTEKSQAGREHTSLQNGRDYVFPESLGVFFSPAYKDCTNLLYFNSQLLPKNKKSKLSELLQHSKSLYLFTTLRFLLHLTPAMPKHLPSH